ncbi:MAG: MFS transporter [Acidobacteria bacterium]|nr:MFS transporter [Acidobacteriota bacterium]
MVTTLLGPLLPLLSLRWSVSSAQAGTLFFWQFASSTAATLLSGLLLSKRSFRVPSVAGTVLCLAGVLALTSADWTWGRYAVACYGCGLGIALPAINLAVAEANPLRRAGSVSLLNFAWGIGAICGPVLLRVTRSVDLFLFMLAAFLAIGVFVSGFVSMPDKANIKRIEESTLPAVNLWILVPLFASAMFALCGIENAVGGWAASLALPQFSNAFTATDATVAFWTFFLAARALAPIVLRRMSEAKFLFASIIVAIAGVVAFFLANSALTVILACALAGLGIGPGFPLLIARVSEAIGPERPQCTICFAFAGLGAATLPPLVGLLGAKLSQPRAGLLLPVAALILMLPLARKLSELPRVLQ